MNRSRYRLRVYQALVRNGIPPPAERIEKPRDAAEILQRYFDHVRDDRERFIALGLVGRNDVLGVAEISVGQATSASCDPKVLFRTLILMGATRFIIAHNHPSGDATPSLDDIAITRWVAALSEILQIEFVDHIVIGDGTASYTSLRETGSANIDDHEPIWSDDDASITAKPYV